MSTSKILAPPQSHVKDKSALKGWGPLSLEYAGENTDIMVIMKFYPTEKKHYLYSGGNGDDAVAEFTNTL